MLPANAENALEVLKERTIPFSICTMVTRPTEYEEMRESFVRYGFDESNSEFIFIDNSEANQADAFAAINIFLRAARGRFVIICHQDVELIADGLPELSARLEALEAHDPNWALAGNAGGKYQVSVDDIAMRISDPYGSDQSRGPFPQRVSALDENFIVVKASANLAASGDLAGFHCYGMDLAIIADVLGYTSYVIDFHLYHKSAGKVADRQSLRAGELHYEDVKRTVRAKYRERFAPRWVSSPTTEIFIWPKLARCAGYNLRTLLVQSLRPLKRAKIR